MKVLILYNKLFHYRIDIFNELASYCDLEVLYTLDDRYVESEIRFSRRKLEYYKIGRFFFHKENIHLIASRFDVVVIYGDISWLSFMSLLFRKNKSYKTILWTIGVSASYEKKLDQNRRWDKIRNFIYDKADALIFYSDYPVEKYIKNKFNPQKLFVANNSVSVLELEINNLIKNSILFIGTLYKQKGVNDLLYYYKKAYQNGYNLPVLKIVGDGPEKNNLEEWVINNNLSKNVLFLGAIHDPHIKKGLFSTSIVCLSPKQAGLSVLESMGYGVPYVTMYDSISGGEIFNIKHEYNGILLRQISDIYKVLVDLCIDKNKFIKMGENAYAHYKLKASSGLMVDSIMKAVKYVHSNE